MKLTSLIGVAFVCISAVRGAVAVDEPVLGPSERKLVDAKWCSLGTSISPEPEPEPVDPSDVADYIGQGFIWNGGEAGVWDTTTANWIDLEGKASVWQEGAVAIFASRCSCALVGEKKAAEVVVAAPLVTLSGDRLTVAAGKVSYAADCKLVCENGLTIAAGGSFGLREANDTVVGEKGYLTTDEPLLIWPKVKLADVTYFRCSVQSHWGIDGEVRTLTSTLVEGKEGIYKYVYDPITDTATCQIKIQANGGVCSCVKVLFAQTAEGVTASFVYAKAALDWGGYDDQKKYGQNWDNVWQIDFDDGAYRENAKLKGEGETLDNYHVHIFDFESIVLDVLPTQTETIVRGAFVNEGALAINFGSLTLDGTYASLPNITLAEGASLVVGEHGSVVFSNEGTGDVKNVITGGPIEVYGTLTVDKSKSANTYGPYNLFGKCSAVNVRAGGELILASDTYSHYGFSGARFNAYEGGKIRLTVDQAIGVNNNQIALFGGRIENEMPRSNEYLTDFTLADGAVVTGGRYLIGYYDLYVGTDGDISKVKVTGSQPSRIEASELLFGNANGKPTGTGNDEIAEFTIEDVTGDAASDLIITSPIRKNGKPVLTVADGASADNRLYYGLVKKGAGTLELNGELDMVGSVTLADGTLRLGANAQGTLGAIVLTGNAAIDVVPGSHIVFDDASALAWTEGAKLNVTGRLRKGKLVVGKLTAAQLAQITYEGKAGKVYVDDTGCLRANTALVLSIR